ncbi:MAG: hypothetical protein ACJAYU_004006 [Bradymonadia bacterium]|jgi:hypothetical protein
MVFIKILRKIGSAGTFHLMSTTAGELWGLNPGDSGQSKAVTVQLDTSPVLIGFTIIPVSSRGHLDTDGRVADR